MTREELEKINSEINQCKTQSELDLFHQKNALLIYENPELLQKIYNKRCEIINESIK